MSEKLTNNNIDDIFRNSIDNMETEPSENFWINASEDALFKSTQAGKKAVTRWKVIAAASITLLIGLSAYMFYMQKQLSNIKSKLIVVENKNTIPIVSASNVPEVKEHVLSATSTDNNAGKEVSNIAIPANKIESSVPANSNNVNTDKVQVANKAIVLNSNIHSKHVNHTYSRVTADNSIVPKANDVIRNDVLSNGESSNTSSNVVIANKVADGPVSMASVTNESIPINEDEQNLITGNIEPVQEYVRPVQKKSFASKLSVSLFYEPYVSDELLENESSDIVTYNNVSANEEEVNPFSLGLKAGYDISKHISVITGCTYYSFNFSVSPTTIFAQQQSNGDAAYSFQTSVGTVQCPYVNNSKAGDGLTVSGEEKVSYVSIPLQIKYNLTLNKKFDVYVTAGVQANIVAIRKMDMHWQSFNWDEGNATEGIDNRKKLYGSYYAAAGLSYSIVKGIGIFMEPSIQGSPVYSSTKGMPYLGMAGGLTYHF